MPLIDCPKCASKISDRANFCPKCGTSTVESKKCPDCFSGITDEMESCPECGCPLHEEIPGPTKVTGPQIPEEKIQESITPNIENRREEDEAIIRAIRSGDYEEVVSLVNKGYNLSLSYNGILEGNSLHTAVTKYPSYCLDTIAYLIKHGANVDEYDERGRTPLCSLVHPFGRDDHEKNLPIFELLLSSGANPNHQEREYKETSLHLLARTIGSIYTYADLTSEWKMVQLLIEAGADTGIVNHKNETFIDILKESMPDYYKTPSFQSGRLLPRVTHTYPKYHSILELPNSPIPDYRGNTIYMGDRPCCGGHGQFYVGIDQLEKEVYQGKKVGEITKFWRWISGDDPTKDMPKNPPLNNATCQRCNHEYNYCLKCDTVWSRYDKVPNDGNGFITFCPNCKERYEF